MGSQSLLSRDGGPSQGFVWIDNDAARQCLIRGDSGSPVMAQLVRAFNDLDRKWPALNWFARVPSASNVADWPSRGLGQKAAELIHADGAQAFPDSLGWRHFLKGCTGAAGMHRRKPQSSKRMRMQ